MPSYDPAKNNTVIIVGFPYRILVEPVVRNHLDEPIEGCFDPDKALISISKASTTDMMNETLLHEILHGVSDATQASLTEDQVYRISRALYASGVRPGVVFGKKDCKKD